MADGMSISVVSLKLRWQYWNKYKNRSRAFSSILLVCNLVSIFHDNVCFFPFIKDGTKDWVIELCSWARAIENYDINEGLALFCTVVPNMATKSNTYL